MTKFRPCIDLHNGAVKQIVGGTLNDTTAPVTNFVSNNSAEWFAHQYRSDKLTGGHVIKLGPGNEAAALEALKAYPGGLQIGGGITPDNALSYLEAGASHVIVTSYLFTDKTFDYEKLKKLVDTVGKDRLILDLSCRAQGESWFVATDRWQTVTDTEITSETLSVLEKYCAEFLVHAADVEGLQGGIDTRLVAFLADHTTIPVTYAGGARTIADLQLVHELSHGKIDLTIGSALDIFGGSGVTYAECLSFNSQET
ncbi:MAG: phosphoribosylformimino-5-aminoimidazole carboxamide ribotide isomerase [Fibrobacterales bacterium]